MINTKAPRKKYTKSSSNNNYKQKSTNRFSKYKKQTQYHKKTNRVMNLIEPLNRSQLKSKEKHLQQALNEKVTVSIKSLIDMLKQDISITTLRQLSKVTLEAVNDLPNIINSLQKVTRQIKDITVKDKHSYYVEDPNNSFDPDN